MKVDYNKIYEFLSNTKMNVVSASSIAYGIGADRVYGATMTKLVRDGYLTPAFNKGYYYNHNHR